MTDLEEQLATLLQQVAQLKEQVALASKSLIPAPECHIEAEPSVDVVPAAIEEPLLVPAPATLAKLDGPPDPAFIAALAAEMKAQKLLTDEPSAPPVERTSSSSFVAQPGPEGFTGAITESAPTKPPEKVDNQEDRAKLLALLFANPSGLPGAFLLDRWRIPPQTIELARREGQVGWAERGLGLTHAWGGAWAPDVENIDVAAIERYKAMFQSRLEA